MQPAIAHIAVKGHREAGLADAVRQAGRFMSGSTCPARSVRSAPSRRHCYRGAKLALSYSLLWRLHFHVTKTSISATDQFFDIPAQKTSYVY
jgi:hypothetical protein